MLATELGRGCQVEVCPKVKGLCPLHFWEAGLWPLQDGGLAREENSPAQSGVHLVPGCSVPPPPPSEAQGEQGRSGVFVQARGGALKIHVFRP